MKEWFFNLFYGENAWFAGEDSRLGKWVSRHWITSGHLAWIKSNALYYQYQIEKFRVNNDEPEFGEDSLKDLRELIIWVETFPENKKRFFIFW